MSEQFVSYLEGLSPLVLSAPHSGIDFTGMPDFVTGNLRMEDPDVKRTLCGGVDIGVFPSTGFHDLDSSHDHARIMTTFPRVGGDVNRAKTDVDDSAVEDGGDPANSHGFIWTATGEVTDNLADIGRVKIGNLLRRPYTKVEFDRLCELIYDPYIRAVRAALANAISKNGFGVLLDLHTFPGHTATKIPPGSRHAGAYVLGPKALRAPVSSMADIIQGKMPDLFMIADFDEAGKPRSCHQIITDIIREEFERDGFLVTNGFPPMFQGNTGSVGMYRDCNAGQHVVALELVGHDLEPNRVLGTLEVNQVAAARFRLIYARVFRRLAALRADDVKMAA